MATGMGRKREVIARLKEVENSLAPLENEAAGTNAPFTPLQEAHIRHAELLEDLRLLDYKEYTNRQHTQADRAGPLLARLLSDSPIHHPILTVLDQAGNPTNTQLGINTAFKDYYTTLYSPPQPLPEDAFETFMRDLTLPQLTERQAKDLKCTITIAEIKQAIRSLPKGKTPGTDGLPADFYATFIDLLAPRLHAVYIEALRTTSLPQSSMQALITSLLKPAKEGLQMADYRPLSLLNTDSKILSKVSAYEKGEIWVDIARAVRSEGGPRRRLRNIKKRWQDIRCWSRRIARVQLKLEAPRRHGGSRQLTPNMLRVLEVVFPDLHRQLQEGQQHEGASSSESGGDRGADQAEGHTDSATCWEVSEGGSGTEWEESLQAARHVTDTSYHADESETDSQEGGEYAAMVTHTSLAALPSSSPISNLPLLGVPRVRASPRVSFVPGTAAPAPVSPAALSAETVDLLRQIAVGQASMLSVLHGHTQLITQVVSFMEGMSSAMSDLRRSVAAIESTLTAAMYTQQHLSPPHPSEPSTSASHIPTQHTRTRHRSDTPSAHTQHKKLKAPRTQSQGQVGTPTGRGETPHTHIHTPSRTDSQPCTSTPNVSPGSGGSFSALAEVCSQVFESTFGDAPTSVDESTTPAPTPPVLPSPVHAVPEDSTDGAPIVSTAD
ncbi:uncharacterized protein LOC144752850 [Lissotriton helveticus]